MDKTERYLKSIDNSLKVIVKALSEKESVTKDTPITRGKPQDRKYK